MTILALVAAGLWAGFSPPQDMSWLKLEQAKAVGARTGKLILVYVACDPHSGNAPCSGGVAERAFSDPAILKRQEDFHFVRVCEKKTAQIVKADKPPEAIFIDADGDEIYRSAFIDGPSLEKAMSAALQRYAPREIRWRSEMPPGPAPKQILVVGFDDDKAELLKTFEDRTLIKYLDRLEFVRLPMRKDPEIVKKWGLNLTPTVLLCDASKEAPEKFVLDRVTGKKNAVALKAALLKALAKLEPKK